jgi:hypothetical protein
MANGNNKRKIALCHEFRTGSQYGREVVVCGVSATGLIELRAVDGERDDFFL